MCNSYESRSVSARAESYKKVRKQIYIYKFLPPHVLLGSGSGINIPDPQHCWQVTCLSLFTLEAILEVNERFLTCLFALRCLWSATGFPTFTFLIISLICVLFKALWLNQFCQFLGSLTNFCCNRECTNQFAYCTPGTSIYQGYL